MTFHEVGQLTDLFRGLFKILHFFEEKEPVQTILQGTQYWHQFDIIAVKKAAPPEKPLLMQYSSQPEKKKATQSSENNSPSASARNPFKS